MTGEVSDDGLMEIVEHGAMLLDAGGGGGPDAFAPASAARTAGALGDVTVLDHEADGLLGQVVGGFETRRGDEQLFFADVAAYPESGVAERYKRLGLSVRQGQKLKAWLIHQDLIQEVREHTRFGRLNRIRLTGKGRLVLNQSADSTLQPGD